MNHISRKSWPHLCIALLMLNSCSNAFTIKPVSKNGIVVGFFEPEMFGYTALSPCLKWLRVYDESNKNKPIWSIESKKNCSTVSSISIGDLTEDFIVQGRKPFSGHNIRVTAQDGNGRFGSSAGFVIVY